MSILKIVLMVLASMLVPSMVLSQQQPLSDVSHDSYKITLAQAPTSAAEEPSVGSVVLDTAKEHLEKMAEKEVAEESETLLPDLMQDGAKVYSDWKGIGWMAGLLALVVLLMNLLRFGPINEFFKIKKIMWLKPLLAAAFGGIAAGLTTAMTGAGVGPSIAAGIMAGLGAVGLYETAKRRKAENRVK